MAPAKCEKHSCNRDLLLFSVNTYLYFKVYNVLVKTKLIYLPYDIKSNVVLFKTHFICKGLFKFRSTFTFAYRERSCLKFVKSLVWCIWSCTYCHGTVPLHLVTHCRRNNFVVKQDLRVFFFYRVIPQFDIPMYFHFRQFAYFKIQHVAIEKEMLSRSSSFNRCVCDINLSIFKAF